MIPQIAISLAGVVLYAGLRELAGIIWRRVRTVFGDLKKRIEVMEERVHQVAFNAADATMREDDRGKL